MNMFIPQFVLDIWSRFPPLMQYLFETTFWIVVVMISVILTVAFTTYFERKVIGYMQGRLGPNRVGPWGLGQPFADVIKLLIKEVVVPQKSNRFLFVIAPLLTLVPALATWAVVPLTDTFVIADINAGLLYVLALTSVGVYGVILAGWATNSKYAFLGAMRSAAQIVAYEIAMGFALVGVLMAGGSLNLGVITEAQAGGVSSWFWLPLCRCSSFTSSPVSPRPIARHLMSQRANPKSSQVSMLSIPVLRSPCSSSVSMQTSF